MSRVPEDFAALFERDGARDFFLTRDWFELLSAQGLDPALDRLILGARSQGGTPAALMPLASSDGKVTGLANYYTMLYAPLINTSLPDSEVADALRAIARTLKAQCCTVHLRPMAADAPVLPALSRTFREAGFVVDSYPCSAMRYLDCRGLDAATFTAGLESRITNTIRRNMGDMRAPDSFALYTEPSEVDRAMTLYEAVYAASWKEAEPFPGFMRALAELCARRGMLRLGCWSIDGDPAAAQFWIVHNGRATIYKLAHDRLYHTRSVGSALTLRMFQEILDGDHPGRIDFGLGEEPFKADWTPDSAPRIGWLAFNPLTPRGAAAAARHKAGRLFRLSRRRKGV
ncbi:GNAT family N-acetyltransferase [Emcibacter sp. SYSU 3D8]|uniref:GNAT family N-acetyltransferase n=1 Tax=Emcibacter sp. SYSU 3D8 TaxID=3133969 RepID=UPI0031FE685B